MTSTVQALLFDLGCVVVDIDFSRALKAWSTHSSLSNEELADAFRFDSAYEQHERGQISSRDYFEHLKSVLRLSASHRQIEDGWNAIFKGEIVESRQLIQRARRTFPCYAFSNTNQSHMPFWSTLLPEVAKSFDRIFASHLIGMRKPERNAFELICSSVGCEPASILFFDDLDENVQAARTAGLQAVLVRSPKDVESALKATGAA
jgi:glucose-1-phosphatase